MLNFSVVMCTIR